MRACAGSLVFNDAGHFLVGERLRLPGQWQFPQGGIDPDESLREAAVRETFEETGIEASLLFHVADLPHGPQFEYRFPEGMTSPIAREFAGQSLGFSIFYFDSPQPLEEVMDLKAGEEFGEQQEFSRLKWAPLDEVVQGCVPFKRVVYENAALEARPIVDSFVARMVAIKRGSHGHQ